MREEQTDGPKRLHCRELGSQRTGITTISGDSIQVYFVGYDEFVKIPDGQPLYIGRLYT